MPWTIPSGTQWFKKRKPLSYAKSDPGYRPRCWPEVPPRCKLPLPCLAGHLVFEPLTVLYVFINYWKD
jgi:hypothetical protein